MRGGLICMCVNQYARGCSDPSRCVQRRDRRRIWIYIRTMWNMRGVNARMTALDMSRHMDKPSDYMLCTLDEGLSDIAEESRDEILGRGIGG